LLRNGVQYKPPLTRRKERLEMKKIFVLMIGIAGLALTIAPQVQAQSAADVQEMQKLTDDFQAGKISLPEFQKRITAIQNRMGAGADDEAPPAPQPRQQAQQKGVSLPVQRVTFPGAAAGWPGASAFRRYGITMSQPSPQTPHGITASYQTQGEKLTIYLTKNFIPVDLDEDNVPGKIHERTNFTDAERLAILNHVQRAFGVAVTPKYIDYWNSTIKDPTRKDTAEWGYEIGITVRDTNASANTIMYANGVPAGVEGVVDCIVIEIESHAYDYKNSRDKG
jgi:hypothetical protein